MRRLLMSVLVLGLAATLSASQAGKDETAVRGVWQLGIEAGHVVPVGMELTQEGSEVRGVILMPASNGERREVSLTGRLSDRELVLHGVGEAHSNAGDLTLTATVKEDGTLSGQIAMGERKAAFTGERLTGGAN